MSHKLKILDADRKGILRLPNGALKLWMCYWMNESVGQESWLSLQTITKQTGLTKPTVWLGTRHPMPDDIAHQKSTVLLPKCDVAAFVLAVAP